MKFKNSKKSVDFKDRNRVISISNQARRTSKRRAERKRKKIWKNLLTKLMNKSSILICANEVEIQRWRDWSLKTEQKLNTKERQLFYKKRSFRDLKIRVKSNGEFDPGSGWTLAACLIHASRTKRASLLELLVANGWVIHKQPTCRDRNNAWKRVLKPDR